MTKVEVQGEEKVRVRFLSGNARVELGSDTDYTMAFGMLPSVPFSLYVARRLGVLHDAVLQHRDLKSPKSSVPAWEASRWTLS